MKFVKIAGLCLASMLMMGMALAGTASAAVPLWLLCLEGTNANNTKYEDNQCTKAKSGGKWESVAIENKSDTVRIVALSLRLEDTKGELGATVVVHCNHVSGIGLIEGRNLLLVRQASVPKPTTECTAEGKGFLKACKTSTLEEVKGTSLPWVSEVYEEKGGKFISRIQPSGEGKGEPGWTVRCSGVEDGCVSEGAGKLEEVSGENKVTEGVLLVFGVFKKAHKAKCSQGGKEAGEVEGFLAILLSNGNGLSLNL